MQCPNCGFELSSQNIHPPLWVDELRGLLRSPVPLFTGLIEGEKWRDDPDLAAWMKKGWVRIQGGGFVATERARKIVESCGLTVRCGPK